MYPNFHLRTERSIPDWLGPATRDWVRNHGRVLADIYAAFHGSGAWPDPVQRSIGCGVADRNRPGVPVGHGDTDCYQAVS